jgi:hypothetical protein
VDSTNDPVLDQMQALIDTWQAAADQRAIFLSCYHMMTANMLAALRQDEFLDPTWVDGLLRRFADYYFTALAAYERDPEAAPSAWRLAFASAGHAHLNPLQKLLLGVNAHINYDLSLAIYDMLVGDWALLSDDGRAARHTDHCRVNEVIAHTVDAVQSQIIEPEMPVLRVFDYLLGPVDEILTSRLITAWRDTVWRNANRLLESPGPGERVQVIAEIEGEALRIAGLIV